MLPHSSELGERGLCHLGPKSCACAAMIRLDEYCQASVAVADDWEDWEDESFQPKLETATNGQTKGQAALAVAKEPDVSKFAGEDEEDEAPPSWEKSIPKPQQVCCCHAGEELCPERGTPSPTNSSVQSTPATCSSTGVAGLVDSWL